MAQTDEQQEAYIQALVREQKGYEVRLTGAEQQRKAAELEGPVAQAQADEAVQDLKRRVEGVQAELKRVGGKAQAPAKRSERR